MHSSFSETRFSSTIEAHTHQSAASRKETKHNNKERKKGSDMDPCRIRSYLQVACAGLGFDIGEIWWTSNEYGSSTVAAIGE